MKILIIEGSQKPPTFVCNLIEGLLSRGLSVSLLGKDGSKRYTSNSKSFKNLITNFRYLNSVRIMGSLAGLFFSANSEWRQARKDVSMIRDWRLRIKTWRTYTLIFLYNPHVIHFQWAAHLEFYEPIIKAQRIPVILSLRGRHVNVSPYVNTSLGNLYKDLFPYISGFHAVSYAMARLVEGFGAAPPKTKVIYSYVPSLFINAYKREPTSHGANIKILSIGRYNWQKGYSDALLAMRILKERNITCSYSIISPGEVPTELLYITKQLELGDRVKFIAGVAHDKIPSFMHEHSVLLLPSIQEGIANVVLEAMGVGLPVISTNCGGMAEVIEDKVNGWLIPVRSPEEMAESLEKFTKLSLTEINQVKENAHQTILARFREEKSMSEFVQLYKAAGNHQLD